MSAGQTGGKLVYCVKSNHTESGEHMAKQIAENLWQLEIPLEGNPLKTLNSYLILDEERSLLIDTGFRWQSCRLAMEKELVAAGVD